MLADALDIEEKDVLRAVNEYTDALLLIDQYDHQALNTLYNNIVLGNTRTLPSIFSDVVRNAPTITLHWNANNKRYQETVTDTNGVLSNFDLAALKAYGVNYEVVNANKVIFYSNVPFSKTTDAIQVNPIVGTYAEKHCTTSAVYYGNPTGDQPLIKAKTIASDPIKGYVKFNTEG